MQSLISSIGGVLAAWVVCAVVAGCGSDEAGGLERAEGAAESERRHEQAVMEGEEAREKKTLEAERDRVLP